MDGASGLCVGCLRTLGEIAGWSAYPPAERDRILGELEGRRTRVDPAILASPRPPFTG